LQIGAAFQDAQGSGILFKVIEIYAYRNVVQIHAWFWQPAWNFADSQILEDR